MKYRKKPVIIEAIRFLGPFSVDEMDFEWGKEFSAFRWYAEITNEIRIETLEGVMTAFSGDWIIKGIKGEFYPCKPDIFESTHEAVSE